jgi:hypothetical protein
MGGVGFLNEHIIFEAQSAHKNDSVN